MRSSFIAALILAVPMIPARAEAPASARKIHKVIIANLTADTARAMDVEVGLKQELLNKRVVADSLRSLTNAGTKPETVKALAELIQSKGYDSILCIGVRKTMQVMDADKASDFPTMESCLSIILTGKYPSGQSLLSEPFVVDAEPMQQSGSVGTPSTQRTPIATNSAAVPVTYYRRKLRLFDVSTQNLIWEEKMTIKLAADLRGSQQAARIARETSKVLEQSGLLPK